MPVKPYSPDALCTFTPDGMSPVSLGTEDCWIEVIPEEGRTLYIVHAQYTGRAGEPWQVTDAERAAIEAYPQTLYDAIKPKAMRDYGVRDGIPIYVPRPGHLFGTLINPYTSFTKTNLYPLSIEFEDVGNRTLILTITFQSIDSPGTSVVGTPDFTWGAVNIGNQPGAWEEQPDGSFLSYTVTTFYSGAGRATYLSTLADSLGLDPTVEHQYPRGAAGNRGVIKSYNQASDTLTWVSEGPTAVGDTFPVALSGQINEDGIVEITAEFRKVR